MTKGKKGKPVTSADIKGIIQDDNYDDDDIRTCFWLYMDSQKGDKSPAKIKEISMVLKIMEIHRPNAYKLLIENVKKITALSKS